MNGVFGENTLAKLAKSLEIEVFELFMPVLPATIDQNAYNISPLKNRHFWGIL